MSNEYYSVKGSLVKDHVSHYSYNLTNAYDAVKLCEKLNNQEIELKYLRECEKQFKEVNKQLKQVLMSLKILQSDIEKLKETMEKHKEILL